MTKRLNAKHKIDRRLGCNLWGRPRSPFNKRNTKPGQHGAAAKRKPSDYGTQLQAKQKLKFYYGDISEHQFKKIYTYSDLSNKRACSLTNFRNFCNPARTFSACSFIVFIKSFIPARLL